MRSILYTGIACLLLLNFTSSALSPRLLIALPHNSGLKATALTAHLNAHVLHQADDTLLAEQINHLDTISDNHRIIIEGSIENLETLARNTGYDFLTLDEKEITLACNSITTREKEIPLTDAQLPRIDSEIAGLLYDLMMRCDKIFKEQNITYWAAYGTLLGAVRHRGLIPWDDDLDICMFMHDIPKLFSLKQVLHEHGLYLTTHRYGFYKISFINGRKLKIPKQDRSKYGGKKYYSWTFPFLDIFPVYLDDHGKICHASDKAQALWPQEIFLPHELLPPFILLPFGPMHIPTLRNAENIITRMYGKDWKHIAYCEYNHQKENFVKKIKVTLIDKSSVPYILPVP